MAEDCAVAAIDAILDEHGELPWNAEAFDDLRRTASARAPGIASAALATAADVLAGESRIRRRLDELVAESARPVVADVEAQLGRLLTPGFVVTVGTARLPDVLRYLRAIEYRLERLDVVRDVRRVEELTPLERRYDVLRRRAGAGPAGAALAEIGWQLEELRVSVFAQHLGTTRPVSPTRIRRALDALEP